MCVFCQLDKADKLHDVSTENMGAQLKAIGQRTENELELDLKECIGTYEFGVVPRSLFASDVSLLLVYDKASVLHHLEKMNGMAVVYSVTKT